MSDDLISRKRLKDALEKNFGNIGGASVLLQLIDAQPVAFDKEKVIETLTHLEKSSSEFEDRYYDELAAGEASAYRVAIGIVEKEGDD